MDWATVGLGQAVAAIKSGRVSSEELVGDCLARIRDREDQVMAWAYLDPEHALNQARAADLALRQGRETGPLCGVPLGVKDIIDTSDMPTENGTVLHAGRQPSRDAGLVSQLRGAGAVIMGKTVSTELAVYSPGKTTNPHNPAYSPGGSSSGSAAAVAAGMVPAAIGTQTNGSVIRPASYCGVVGYKPGHGLVSRAGVLAQSRPLDQVGVFGRGLEDVALVARAIMHYDARDPDMRPRARPRLAEALARELPFEPRLAFVKGPVWGQAEPEARRAFEELAGDLADRVVETELPEIFEQAHATHRSIMEADLALSFQGEYREHKELLSEVLREMLERGRRVTALEYNRALARVPLFNQALEGIFQTCQAILTPATGGEAPLGLASTGSPAFCTIWTLCGLPAISLPLLQGPAGLPMGVQLVGPRGGDASLLRTARWLMERLAR